MVAVYLSFLIGKYRIRLIVLVWVVENMNAKNSLQSIKEHTKDFWWLVPFFAFYLGYWVPHTFFRIKSLETPSLLGKQVHESLVLLSEAQLNLRLVGEKEDAALPEGTIVSQIPAPYQKIKPHQALFVTVSKKPQTSPLPLSQGKFAKELSALFANKKIRFKPFYIQSAHPADCCIAHYPYTSTVAPDEPVILYFSKDAGKTVLFPDLEGLSVKQVKDFFAHYGITPHVFHTKSVFENHECLKCVVTEQKPLPGSLLNLNKPLSVQLKVSS